MTVKIYKEENANAIFVENESGARFLNSLQANVNDENSNNVDIHDRVKDIKIISNTPHSEFVNNSDESYGVDATEVVNTLNTLFSVSGTATGELPSITSNTTINITTGDSINYEMTATYGVGYEWENLPSGVTTVEGNVRKLVGGAALSAGTYNLTMRAVNYHGDDTQTLQVIVSDPPYNNTRSVNFANNDYMAGQASVNSPFYRSGNGSGNNDAWSLSMWYKGSTSNNGQVLFYYGSSDLNNGGYIELRQTNQGGQKRLRLRYGSNNNYLQITTGIGSIVAGTWQHVLITYDGGTTGSSSAEMSTYYGRFKIYIDGVLQSTVNSHSNYGYTGSIGSDNFRLGRLLSGNSLRNARIDEVAIWASDESSEISAIYNSGVPHDLTTLVEPPDHWWRMGDGDTFPTITDNIGNNDLTMYNMTVADIVNDVP